MAILGFFPSLRQANFRGEFWGKREQGREGDLSASNKKPLAHVATGDQPYLRRRTRQTRGRLRYLSDEYFIGSSLTDGGRAGASRERGRRQRRKR